MDKTEKKDLIEKMVTVNRVTKVVKGGRIMRFSALVVVGDGNGRVGLGMGKAKEVPLAVTKATEEARKEMKTINLFDRRTIHHTIKGRHGASSILLKPASAGTGVIAGGPVRMILEAVGIRDVLVKNIGSTNPHNILRAAMKALLALASPEQVAMRRGLSVEKINKRYRSIGV